VTVLGDEEIRVALAARPGWAPVGRAIAKEWSFPSFPDAVAFVVRVAFVAEAVDHHPDIDLRYRRVRLSLSSHDAGGVTQRDLDLADRVDALAAGT
jgi:4a-hydroxytetrahydrobiopterin dehydratase